MSVLTAALADTEIKALYHNHCTYKYTVTNVAMHAPSVLVCLRVYLITLSASHIRAHTQWRAICHYNELESEQVYMSVAVLTLLYTHRKPIRAYLGI